MSESDKIKVRVTREEAEAAVRTIITYIGDDPKRSGVLDTPARVVRAYDELFAGYREEAHAPLARVFGEEVDGDQMIIVRDIDFVSHCEHHMLPFIGKATVAYIPGTGASVVGLSKIARCVRILSSRLQIQERLTREIADALEFAVKPLGVGVVVESSHQCMTCRGVRARDAVMVTHALRGVFRQCPDTRGEFFSRVGSMRS